MPNLAFLMRMLPNHRAFTLDQSRAIIYRTHRGNARASSRAIGTTKHRSCGARVQIPAYTDAWMRGARFGTVERVREGKGSYLDPRDPRGATRFGVRMDHPQIKRMIWVIADDCTYSDGGQ